MVACLITIQCTYTEYSYYILLSQLRQLKQKNVWIFYAESLNKLSWIDFAVKFFKRIELRRDRLFLTFPDKECELKYAFISSCYDGRKAFALLNFDWFLAITMVIQGGGSPISGNVAECLIVKEHGLSLLQYRKYKY